jgi:hypothetical protein
MWQLDVAARTVYSSSSGDDEELLGSSSMGTRTDWQVYSMYLAGAGRNNFRGRGGGVTAIYNLKIIQKAFSNISVWKMKPCWNKQRFFLDTSSSIHHCCKAQAFSIQHYLSHTNCWTLWISAQHVARPLLRTTLHRRRKKPHGQSGIRANNLWRPQTRFILLIKVTYY